VFLLSFVSYLSLPSGFGFYSNRVAVPLPQRVAIRLPLASKSWIVALYVKLLPLVRSTSAMMTSDPINVPFPSYGNSLPGKSNSEDPAGAPKDHTRACQKAPNETLIVTVHFSITPIDDTPVLRITWRSAGSKNIYLMCLAVSFVRRRLHR